MPRSMATFIMIIATMVWGFAFIAQKSAMDSMGPLTFLASRYLLGGIVILPLAWFEHKRQAEPISKRAWGLIFILSAAFFLGSWLQQAGLLTATVTNAGFLTGLYVFFVPFILTLFFRQKLHYIVWVCAPLALLGLYLLNGARLDNFVVGDFLVMSSAIFWAVHVMMLGYTAALTKRPITVSAFVFILAGLYSLGGGFALETVNLEVLQLGWKEIVYAGLLSTAVGFTLQAIGQQHVPAANAAIILSGESLFAAIGAALVLGERLSLVGYFGAVLIFIAIVLVETVPIIQAKRKQKHPIDPVTNLEL